MKIYTYTLYSRINDLGLPRGSRVVGVLPEKTYPTIVVMQTDEEERVRRTFLALSEGAEFPDMCTYIGASYNGSHVLEKL